MPTPEDMRKKSSARSWRMDSALRGGDGMGTVDRSHRHTRDLQVRLCSTLLRMRLMQRRGWSMEAMLRGQRGDEKRQASEVILSTGSGRFPCAARGQLAPR